MSSQVHARSIRHAPGQGAKHGRYRRFPESPFMFAGKFHALISDVAFPQQVAEFVHAIDVVVLRAAGHNDESGLLSFGFSLGLVAELMSQEFSASMETAMSW